MYIIIDGKVYDPEKVPVAIGFENDQDRWKTMSNIQNMEPKEGIRLYMVYPDSIPPEQGQAEVERAVRSLKDYLENPLQ